MIKYCIEQNRSSLHNARIRLYHLTLYLDSSNGKNKMIKCFQYSLKTTIFSVYAEQIIVVFSFQESYISIVLILQKEEPKKELSLLKQGRQS